MTRHDITEEFVSRTDRDKDIKRAKNEHLAINWEDKMQNQKILLAPLDWD